MAAFQIAALILVGVALIMVAVIMLIQHFSLKRNVFALLKTGRALSRKKRELLSRDPDALFEHLAKLDEHQYRKLKVFLRSHVEDDSILHTTQIGLGMLSVLIALLTFAYTMQTIRRDTAFNEVETKGSAGLDASQSENDAGVIPMVELLPYFVMVIIAVFALASFYIQLLNRRRRFLQWFLSVIDEFEAHR